ncbi:MAG: MFS transporter [Bacteroidia bacterium]|nr:MFS transporter [Bacteroidia bacterium]
MKESSTIKTRLIILQWLEFAVWGSYLTSMGGYLAKVGLGENIGWFYSVQGIVSIFMPALMGIVADRWVRAERLLSFCHAVAALFMVYVGYIGLQMGDSVSFGDIFPYYAISVAFYMPTIALTYSVSYSAFAKYGLDTIKDYPFVRLFGTVGFIVAMWMVDLLGMQHTSSQFFVCAGWGVVMSVYSLTMPKCPVSAKDEKQSIVEALGLNAFRLFKDWKMAMFFIFCMMLGVSLQISNGYANPFISSFANIEEYSGAFFAEHANMLISLSQVSETLCILMIPFFLSRFGIKPVMLIAMLAWVGRYGFFAIGTPTFPGVTFLILSMIVYGVAFDFFNVSGSLYVNNEVDASMRSSAQGLFMMMTNGFGATIGTLSAQAIINYFGCTSDSLAPEAQLEGWQTSWLIFAAYGLVVAMLFAIMFKSKK